MGAWRQIQKSEANPIHNSPRLYQHNMITTRSYRQPIDQKDRYWAPE